MLKILTVLLLLWPGLTLANDWEALQQPDTFAIMRHALAPGTGDPATFRLNSCETQRNLDARGQAQARNIGAALTARGITFEQVLTSQWCRARDTAQLLAVAPVVDTPALNSFFRDRSAEPQQTRDVMALLRAAEGKLMLVTHQVNVTALTGRRTQSGEVLVVRLTPSGTQVVGSILISP